MKSQLLIAGTFIITSLWAAPYGFAADKTTLAELQKVLHSEEELRAKLDGHLTDALKDMQNIKSTSNSSDIVDATLTQHEGKVSAAKELLLENHLRIEFLNTFISQLEKCQDLRADAPKILLEMSHHELLGQVESGSENRSWLFEMYLSIAMRDILEPSESFAEFVKQYMIYSSLRDPRTPGEFLKSRDYLGGRPLSVGTNNTSKPTKPDEVDDSN